MAFTRSFENFKPPRRFDSVPFETVEVRESATENGTYATIETIALSPVDTDPATPASRNFTTDEAVEAVGWYVIRWVDGGGAFSDSVPVKTRLGCCLVWLRQLSGRLLTNLRVGYRTRYRSSFEVSVWK